uniref:Uncharacterized protein n=1 Tax=Arundo donax TaxID=35708 RepID=A0A0A9A033_ARUDO
MRFALYSKKNIAIELTMSRYCNQNVS